MLLDNYFVPDKAMFKLCFRVPQNCNSAVMSKYCTVIPDIPKSDISVALLHTESGMPYLGPGEVRLASINGANPGLSQIRVKMY